MKTAVLTLTLGDGEQTGGWGGGGVQSRFDKNDTSAVSFVFDGLIMPARPHLSQLFLFPIYLCRSALPRFSPGVVQMLLLSKEPFHMFAITPAPSPAQII